MDTGNYKKLWKYSGNLGTLTKRISSFLGEYILGLKDGIETDLYGVAMKAKKKPKDRMLFTTMDKQLFNKFSTQHKDYDTKCKDIQAFFEKETVECTSKFLLKITPSTVEEDGEPKRKFQINVFKTRQTGFVDSDQNAVGPIKSSEEKKGFTNAIEDAIGKHAEVAIYFNGDKPAASDTPVVVESRMSEAVEYEKTFPYIVENIGIVNKLKSQLWQDVDQDVLNSGAYIEVLKKDRSVGPNCLVSRIVNTSFGGVRGLKLSLEEAKTCQIKLGQIRQIERTFKLAVDDTSTLGSEDLDVYSAIEHNEPQLQLHEQDTLNIQSVLKALIEAATKDPFFTNRMVINEDEQALVDLSKIISQYAVDHGDLKKGNVIVATYVAKVCKKIGVPRPPLSNQITWSVVAKLNTTSAPLIEKESDFKTLVLGLRDFYYDVQDTILPWWAWDLESFVSGLSAELTNIYSSKRSFIDPLLLKITDNSVKKAAYEECTAFNTLASIISQIAQKGFPGVGKPLDYMSANAAGKEVWGKAWLAELNPSTLNKKAILKVSTRLDKLITATDSFIAADSSNKIAPKAEIIQSRLEELYEATEGGFIFYGKGNRDSFFQTSQIYGALDRAKHDIHLKVEDPIDLEMISDLQEGFKEQATLGLKLTRIGFSLLNDIDHDDTGQLNEINENVQQIMTLLGTLIRNMNHALMRIMELQAVYYPYMTNLNAFAKEVNNNLQLSKITQKLLADYGKLETLYQSKIGKIQSVRSDFDIAGDLEELKGQIEQLDAQIQEVIKNVTLVKEKELILLKKYRLIVRDLKRAMLAIKKDEDDGTEKNRIERSKYRDYIYIYTNNYGKYLNYANPAKVFLNDGDILSLTDAGSMPDILLATREQNQNFPKNSFVAEIYSDIQFLVQELKELNKGDKIDIELPENELVDKDINSIVSWPDKLDEFVHTLAGDSPEFLTNPILAKLGQMSMEQFRESIAYLQHNTYTGLDLKFLDNFIRIGDNKNNTANKTTHSVLEFIDQLTEGQSPLSALDIAQTVIVSKIEQTVIEKTNHILDELNGSLQLPNELEELDDSLPQDESGIQEELEQLLGALTVFNDSKEYEKIPEEERTNILDTVVDHGSDDVIEIIYMYLKKGGNTAIEFLDDIEDRLEAVQAIVKRIQQLSDQSVKIVKNNQLNAFTQEKAAIEAEIKKMFAEGPTAFPGSFEEIGKQLLEGELTIIINKVKDLVLSFLNKYIQSGGDTVVQAITMAKEKIETLKQEIETFEEKIEEYHTIYQDILNDTEIITEWYNQAHIGDESTRVLDLDILLGDEANMPEDGIEAIKVFIQWYKKGIKEIDFGPGKLKTELLEKNVAAYLKKTQTFVTKNILLLETALSELETSSSTSIDYVSTLEEITTKLKEDSKKILHDAVDNAKKVTEEKIQEYTSKISNNTVQIKKEENGISLELSTPFGSVSSMEELFTKFNEALAKELAKFINPFLLKFGAETQDIDFYKSFIETIEDGIVDGIQGGWNISEQVARIQAKLTIANIKKWLVQLIESGPAKAAGKKIVGQLLADMFPEGDVNDIMAGGMDLLEMAKGIKDGDYKLVATKAIDFTKSYILSEEHAKMVTQAQETIATVKDILTEEDPEERKRKMKEAFKSLGDQIEKTEIGEALFGLKGNLEDQFTAFKNGKVVQALLEQYEQHNIVGKTKEEVDGALNTAVNEARALVNQSEEDQRTLANYFVLKMFNVVEGVARLLLTEKDLDRMEHAFKILAKDFDKTFAKTPRSLQGPQEEAYRNASAKISEQIKQSYDMVRIQSDNFEELEDKLENSFAEPANKRVEVGLEAVQFLGEFRAELLSEYSLLLGVVKDSFILN